MCFHPMGVESEASAVKSRFQTPTDTTKDRVSCPPVPVCPWAPDGHLPLSGPLPSAPAQGTPRARRSISHTAGRLASSSSPRSCAVGGTRSAGARPTHAHLRLRAARLGLPLGRPEPGVVSVGVRRRWRGGSTHKFHLWKHVPACDWEEAVSPGQKGHRSGAPGVARGAGVGRTTAAPGAAPGGRDRCQRLPGRAQRRAVKSVSERAATAQSLAI